MSISKHHADVNQPSIRELNSIRVIYEICKFGYGYTEHDQLLTEKIKLWYVRAFGRGMFLPDMIICKFLCQFIFSQCLQFHS